MLNIHISTHIYIKKMSKVNTPLNCLMFSDGKQMVEYDYSRLGVRVETVEM